jgi:hypothetical protein
MGSESERIIEADMIAHCEVLRTLDSFNMQEDVLVDMEDPQVGDSEPSLEDMVVNNVFTFVTHVEDDDDVLATWEKHLPILGDTATAGTSYDATITASQYKCAHSVWKSFLASLSPTILTRDNLSSKDLYLPGLTDDYVNMGLARLFVRYYVDTQGQTKTNFGNALNFLERLLDNLLNKANKIAKRGSIKDDRFLKRFLKDMLVLLADESRAEVHNFHPSFSS